MQYYLDLKTKTLDDYKLKLTTQQLIPSQKLLLDDIDGRFDFLKELGMKTMYDLHQSLKTKPMVERFAKNTSLPFDYLIILRREVYSYQPKARKIQDFWCIKDEIKTKLLVDGIKTTPLLFEKVATSTLRKQFMVEMEISNEDALLLAKLSDLCRLRYVNPDFATLLVHSDYDTVEKIKNAVYKSLFDNITNVNIDKAFYKGKIGLGDMEFFVQDAKFILSGVEL